MNPLGHFGQNTSVERQRVGWRRARRQNGPLFNTNKPSQIIVARDIDKRQHILHCPTSPGITSPAAYPTLGDVVKGAHFAFFFSTTSLIINSVSSYALNNSADVIPWYDEMRGGMNHKHSLVIGSTAQVRPYFPARIRSGLIMFLSSRVRPIQE